MVQEMTPMQRVVAALTFDTPDRVPVALYFQSASQYDLIEADYTWQEALTHPRRLYKIIEKQYTKWGADNFFLPLDFRAEGEAYGAKMNYRLRCGKGYRMPVAEEFIINGYDEINNLQVFDPTKDGRLPAILGAIEKLSTKYANKVPVFGFVNNPVDILADVYSGRYEGVYADLLKNPAFIHKALKVITEGCIEFGKAMVASGATAIATVVGGTTNQVVSPDQYKEFVSDYHRKIRDRIGAPYIYHQCEDGTPFMDHIASVKPACIAFHEDVDLAWMKEKYGKSIALAGNVGVSKADTPMLFGTPDDVDKAAKKAIEIGMPGSGYLLSAGCEVHHGIPPENILALVNAAKKYGVY